MVHYDPHITGMFLSPEKNPKQPGRLVNISRKNHPMLKCKLCICFSHPTKAKGMQISTRNNLQNNQKNEGP